ncbi:hypothetical protein MTR67_044537 [Solanum verrucosum]|uniref:Uncharacterized protein n=1 Tax=Solanum verrucosum TaxID=315347 RepID=A0AAF0ZT04_SOLVR|nr:hypothetical protein MTR67_044537 [Solanum verrucosum]
MYPGPVSGSPLIQLSTSESVYSAELRKPGQGSLGGQRWSSSASHVQGVGSGHDR